MMCTQFVNNVALLGAVLIPLLAAGYLAYVRHLNRDIARIEQVLSQDDQARTSVRKPPRA